MIQTSQRVRASDFGAPWFAVAGELREFGPPSERYQQLFASGRVHRKLWEWAAIASAYRQRFGGYGAAVVGFGVGAEPIPGWMAAQDARVTATDLSPDDPAARQWVETDQHVAAAKPDQRVRHEVADMRDIPERLRCGQFDFSWSSGSLEHLGSIEAGLQFYCQQMECLRPGGLSAHTTEYNRESNGDTLQAADVVFFRRSDLQNLGNLLAAQGDRLWPLDLSPGLSPADESVDHDPYEANPHLSIELGGHVSTSVLLVAERGGAL